MEKEFQLMVAPLQGLTEAAWRSEHFRLFGERQGDVEYFTPFIRLEKGEVRKRDLRDFTSELNRGMKLTPQIIFRDAEEWRRLVDALAEAGATHIDMNMGCPFPPQVRKGRGAGMLMYPDKVTDIASAMTEYEDSISFSVKMRLGEKEPEEVMALTDILNSMKLRHITVHPRTAAQQYKGELQMDCLSRFTSRLEHPVIFNGEISAPSDIEGLVGHYDGVMVGRGLLKRPTLFAEYRSGSELTPEERNESFLNLIGGTISVLEQRLCGATQLKDKIKPYWEYAPDTLDRKIAKQGKKHGII